MHIDCAALPTCNLTPEIKNEHAEGLLRLVKFENVVFSEIKVQVKKVSFLTVS